MPKFVSSSHREKCLLPPGEMSPLTGRNVSSLPPGGMSPSTGRKSGFSVIFSCVSKVIASNPVKIVGIVPLNFIPQRSKRAPVNHLKQRYGQSLKNLISFLNFIRMKKFSNKIHIFFCPRRHSFGSCNDFQHNPCQHFSTSLDIRHSPV